MTRDEKPSQGESSGEIVQLRLESLATGGEAIGRDSGRVIFVAGGLPGETVTVQITEKRRSFARARLLSVDEPSAARVVPRCRHFGECGGCAWQYLDYPAQVRAKGEIVREQLARIGHLPDVEVRDCLPSPAPWAYRNSARMAFSSSGRPGYRAAASHTIVAVDECPILEPALQEQLGSLKRGGSSAKDVELRVAMDPIVVGQYRYHVPLGAFFQVNTAVAELLVREVLAALAPTQEDNVLDLYCGAGLFTAPIAARAGRVLGVEQGEAAIRGARLNLREWPNADALEATVESALAGDRIAGVAWNKIVLDPPRRGVEPGALEQIAALRPARIVYVSCDPATFARDAALLAQRGYRLAFAQPLDMFPQTAHVETVGLFVNP